MIANNINETSVWLDSLEDSNIDISLARFLCIYHYLNWQFSIPYKYATTHSYAIGNCNAAGDGCGNAYGFGNGIGNGLYSEAYEVTTNLFNYVSYYD